MGKSFDPGDEEEDVDTGWDRQQIRESDVIRKEDEFNYPIDSDDAAEEDGG